MATSLSCSSHQDNLQKVQFPLDSAAYQNLQEIGSGDKAVVYEAICVPMNSAIVAIKFVDLNQSMADFKSILRDTKTLSLFHPNNISGHCSYTTADRRLWVVMSFMAFGSLQSIIISSPAFPQGLPELCIVAFLKEMLNAMSYLHGQGHVHGDIKPGKILVDSDGSVKLAAFGVSAAFYGADHATGTNNTLATPYRVAPNGGGCKADTMMVKPGHALNLVMQQNQNVKPSYQIDWMKSTKFKRQADVQGHSHGRGGAMAIVGGAGGGRAPGAGLAPGGHGGRGGRRGGGGGGCARRPGPRRRSPIVYGQRRGNDIDIMKEYHGAVADTLEYVLTLQLEDYVSVGDMISHILRVEDDNMNRAMTPLNRITFMMRRGRQTIQWTVHEARMCDWVDFRRTVQSVHIVFLAGVEGTIQVDIHEHLRQLDRRELPALTELIKRIRGWGALEGDRELFEMQIGGQVRWYDSDGIETYIATEKAG